MRFSDILEIAPYSLEKEQKSQLILERLKELTRLHMESCTEYRKMLECICYSQEAVAKCSDIPFIPVRLFKELDLKSIEDSQVIKAMTSSGTSGQAVSRIYLNKETAANQQKAMVKIVGDYIGSSRMPMLIIDCPSVIHNRHMFSARGAGILGFSLFGSHKQYALTDAMELDIEGLRAFLDKNKGKKILLFGFTFMIWQYFYKQLYILKQRGVTFDLSNAVMIHGGGWKKLVDNSVSQKQFHESLKETCGLEQIYDYYGMVEQTGCIYMQCECGHFHASIFSEIIIRNPYDFSVCKKNEKGNIQVLSTIPESYPGHSLLTEDEGILLGEDNCPCGRKGKYFKVLGRMKSAEVRGCSDTYAAKF